MPDQGAEISNTQPEEVVVLVPMSHWRKHTQPSPRTPFLDHFSALPTLQPVDSFRVDDQPETIPPTLQKASGPSKISAANNEYQRRPEPKPDEIIELRGIEPADRRQRQWPWNGKRFWPGQSEGLF